MPIFYTSISIPYSDALLSVHPFTLPVDGRRIYFELPQGGLQQKLYTVIDNCVSPFVNGNPMETPRRDLERFISLPHSSQLIVVRENIVRLWDFPVEITPVPVQFSSGERAMVHLSCEVHANVRVINAPTLVDDYLNAGIVSAEAEVAGHIKSAVQEVTRQLIAQEFRRVDAAEIASIIPELNNTIEQEVIGTVHHRLKWCQITALECPLILENVDELLTASNRLFELSIENKRKLLDAILTVYGQTPLPAEVGQILLPYLQSNPGISSADVLSLVSGIKKLSERASPDRLLLMAKNMGVIH